MGSRVQKIAFLVFALMFIAIMAVLNTSVLTLGTSANNQLNTTVSSGEVSLNIYDGTTVSGANVRDAAKAPDKICSTDLKITVKTSANTAGTTYTSATGDSYNPAYGGKTAPASGTDAKGQSTYINPTATFESILNYNGNGVVNGITFTQK